MADEKQTLEDLKEIASAAPEELPTESEPEIDSLGRSYATGKRKNAIARVWVKRGNGRITVNGRDQETYFVRPVLRMLLNQPFETADRKGQFDVSATVTGGRSIWAGWSC